MKVAIKIVEGEGSGGGQGDLEGDQVVEVVIEMRDEAFGGGGGQVAQVVSW